MLDQPSTTTGDGGELGLGVDGDGEPDGFEHRQIRCRVGVGNRLFQIEVVFLGVIGEGLIAGFAGGRDVGELAVVGAVVCTEFGRHDVIEQRPQRFDDDIERTGDQQCLVSEGTVGANPTDAGGERLGHEQVAHHLQRVSFEAFDRGVFEAAVEVAQEVTAVGAIEIPERGRLTQRLGDETHAIGGVEMPGRKPRITGDDIARDQGVLEVEDGEMTVFGQHILADPLVAVDRWPLARLHLEAGHLDRRR